MSMLRYISITLLLAVPSAGFAPVAPTRTQPSAFQKTAVSPLFHTAGLHKGEYLLDPSRNNNNLPFPKTTEQTTNLGKLRKLWRRTLGRLDTLESSGLEDAQVAGIFGRIKRLHDPITYIVLGLLSGLRWDWCFRSPYYWFAIGFCIKWYRARYVFKIPVWDRQPNWNNVITSKEQEKDLKAYTCKNCGSTIFIAKTREFFFEGSTGIGGLGCFSCGAKGKDNFVMDRDRIVEDVADMDDYFDYERPLDFVSRAERRKLMKEAQGDEERANQILVERANAEAGTTEEGATNGDAVDDEIVNEEAPTVDEDVVSNDEDDDNNNANPTEEPVVEETEADAGEADDTEDVESVEEAVEEEPREEKADKVEEEPSKLKKEFKKPEPKKDVSSFDTDDFDVLGLD